MTARITFFPVGNGDMTLIETDSGKKILIDCNIRSGDEFPDVLKMLRDRLGSRDSKDRFFIDLFVWTHPDEDHCRGVSEHFHLGAPEDWSEKSDKIFIKGLWSSPIVFRRRKRVESDFCKDAKDLRAEASRRANLYKKINSMSEGNFIAILAKDKPDKMQGVEDIVMELDTETDLINQERDNTFSARLLGPSPLRELDKEEEELGNNDSSVIMNYKISADNNEISAQFLTGGDAAAYCWECLYDRLEESNSLNCLKYDVLQAPHHCSWRSISHDSWSDCKEKGKDPKVSDKALYTLNKANNEAIIVSSSNEIKDEKPNPPCIGAKLEYKKIVDPVKGRFVCVSDIKKDDENMPYTVEISKEGGIKGIAAMGLTSTGSRPNSSVNRKGSDTWA